MLTNDTPLEEAIKQHGTDFRLLFLAQLDATFNMIAYRNLIGKDVFDYWSEHYEDLVRAMDIK